MHDETRFRELFDEHFRAVLGFAARRTASSEDAADAAAETMAIAWRRIADVPDGVEAKLWLYGVARNVLNNQRRSARRNDRTISRLAAIVDTVTIDPFDGTTDAIRRVLATLSEGERDLMHLTTWEGLTPTEAATVLNIHPVTARTRLHRSRRRLKAALSAAGVLDAPPSAGLVPTLQPGDLP